MHYPGNTPGEHWALEERHHRVPVHCGRNSIALSTCWLEQGTRPQNDEGRDGDMNEHAKQVDQVVFNQSEGIRVSPDGAKIGNPDHRQRERGKKSHRGRQPSDILPRFLRDPKPRHVNQMVAINHSGERTNQAGGNDQRKGKRGMESVCQG